MGSVATRRARRRRRVGVCGWCGGELVASRVDARYCTTSCRQAAYRARIRRAALEHDASPLRFAYADPPYPGQSYRGHADYGGEVDHAELLSRLDRYDGWALSTSAAVLPAILGLAVVQDLDVRVAAWIRGARPHATARLVNAWEPVVYAGGRRFTGFRPHPDAAGAVLWASEAQVGVLHRPVKDVLEGVAPRARPTHPGWPVGSKPPAFCSWVFDLLGAGHHPDDELDDLYPGSGIVAWSWALRLAVDPSRVDGANVSRGDPGGRVERGSR
jgi:hypothetical protein